MSQQLYDQYGNPVPQKKKKKKVWLWVIIGIMAIGIIGESLNSSADDKDEPNQSTTVNVGSTDETKSNETDAMKTDATTTVETTIEATTEDNSNIIAFGQSGGDDDIKITVNAVSETTEISEGYFKYSPDSGKYAVIEVTVENIGKSALSFMTSNFRLFTEDDIRYSGTTLITTSGDYFSIETINPGLAKTGYLVFNIPENLNVQDLRMTYTGFSIFAKRIEFALK